MSNSSKLDGRFNGRFWIVTLSALVMAALTFGLGVWQLDRAAQKEKISVERRDAQPISLGGQWLADQTLYVDNRQMKAKQGFFVVTPLVIALNDYVLVERGWIARDFMDRKKLQAIQTPAGEVTISARRLADPALPAVIAANDANAASEHPIVQYVNVRALQSAMPSMTYQGYVQQLGGASEGLKRDWYEPASGVEKHYGYAFQWFALCALLISLYIWFQWIKK
jgi:surfeit locus 1 family protein